MKSKYLKKVILAGMALMIALMTMIVPASAANNGDTYFSLNVKTSSNDYTGAREKQDASGTYVYYKNPENGLSGPVKFRVMGSNSQSSPALLATNYTRNGYGTISKGQERFIWQNVYENGKKYAFLSTPKVASGDPIGTATGLWSPDSVGSYTYCN